MVLSILEVLFPALGAEIIVLTQVRVSDELHDHRYCTGNTTVTSASMATSILASTSDFCPPVSCGDHLVCGASLLGETVVAQGAWDMNGNMSREEQGGDRRLAGSEGPE